MIIQLTSTQIALSVVAVIITFFVYFKNIKSELE